MCLPGRRKRSRPAPLPPPPPAPPPQIYAPPPAPPPAPAPIPTGGEIGNSARIKLKKSKREKAGLGSRRNSLRRERGPLVNTGSSAGAQSINTGI